MAFHFENNGLTIANVDNTCVFAVRTDQADIGPANSFVDTGASVTLWWCVMRSASYDLYPLVVDRSMQPVT